MKLLTPPQVAERLSVSLPTLYRFVAERRLAAVRLSPRCMRFEEESVESFIRGQRDLPTRGD